MDKRGTRKWATDARQIDIARLADVVFVNRIIERFLAEDGAFFLSANKGLGKTLLLTYKRYLLQRSHQGAAARDVHSVHFIPRDQPYLDFMADLPTMSREHVAFLSHIGDCKRAWGLALRVAAISRFPPIVRVLLHPDLDLLRIPRDLVHLISDEGGCDPTVAFAALLRLSVSELHAVIDRLIPVLEDNLRRIPSGVWMFVDKVDQAIRELPRHAWIAVQAGLIEAAWDLMNATPHVRVYATIRQEAFSAYQSDIKLNLLGATTVIRYAQDDLRSLLDKLTGAYEGAPSFDEFIGLSEIDNVYAGGREVAFEYAHRHTVGRPRDLVVIAGELSSRGKCGDADKYREIVNSVAGDNIVRSVFSEMGVFLDCLREENERRRLYGLIRTNILDRAELQAICCAFNRVAQLTGDDSERHPFCELYNCGLLGVVRAMVGGHLSQQFRQPYDVLRGRRTELPPADWYLLHPGLHETISESSEYKVYRHIIVGHGYQWLGWYEAVVRLQASIRSLGGTLTARRVEELLGGIVDDFRAGAEPGEMRKRLEASNTWQVIGSEGGTDGDVQVIRAWFERLVPGEVAGSS